MYVKPSTRTPGLKALRAEAQRKAAVAAEVEATRKRSEAAAAARLIAGK